MILRRIQLNEPRRASVPAAFQDELRLWVDGVSDENIKTLDDFLSDRYQLRAEASGSRVEGYREIEFGIGSLYHLRMPGNLILSCEKLAQELNSHSMEIEQKHKQKQNDTMLLRGYKFENSAEYEAAQLDYASRVGKQHELKYLQDVLASGRSVFVEILKDPAKVIEVTGWGEAPKDYVKEMPLTGSMVMIKFLPFHEVNVANVKDLRNMLLGEDMRYETPRHKEVLDAVLKGDLKEYNGYALFEHRGGESGFLEPVRVGPGFHDAS